MSLVDCVFYFFAVVCSVFLSVCFVLCLLTCLVFTFCVVYLTDFHISFVLVLTDKWLLGKKVHNSHDTTYKPHASQDKEVQSVGVLVILRRSINIFIRTNKGDNVCSSNGRKSHPETSPRGDISHIQSPKTDSLVHAKKYMLTGA